MREKSRDSPSPKPWRSRQAMSAPDNLVYPNFKYRDEVFYYYVFFLLFINNEGGLYNYTTLTTLNKVIYSFNKVPPSINLFSLLYFLIFFLPTLTLVTRL